jgi:hypothetical protein
MCQPTDTPTNHRDRPVRSTKMTSRRTLLLTIICIAIATSTAFAGDPPARVARLNYINGEVSIQPGGVNEWVQGNINRPLTSSDRVWADKDARAELQLGGAALRVDSNTSLTLVNVSDNNVQVQLDQGTASLHVVELFDGEVYEVDTPNVSYIVRKSGDYRFDVDNAGDTTDVTVLKGEGDATGDGPAVHLKKGERYSFSDGKSLRFAINHNPGLDGFDQWAMARADREDRAVSARYVSRYAVGYSDLDEYGSWETVGTYGPVWYPRGIAVGWAPYRYGHWVYVSPWGWTWVDDAPWGFAPFHYGRWVNYRNRWGWCPGPYGVRPIYAPALVGWIGGPHFGVGLAFGIGGGVGWFPLGWGEPFIPYYGHSRGYFENVNIRNTRITNITYVTNNYYGNQHGHDWNYAYRTSPHAVTAVSNDNFRMSRPTRDGFVRVNEHELREASFERNVGLRPTTNSVLGVHAGEHRAAPPATWGHPSRSEHGSVADAENPRPDRISRPNRDAVANGGVNSPNRENGRPYRSFPRPSDRSNPTATAENERPHGIPNPERVNPTTTNNAVSTPNRVPRLPDREDRPQNYGRPNRDVISNTPNNGVAHPTPAAEVPSRSYTPDRETRSVPRPREGQVVRERRQDSVGRDQADQAPRVREERSDPQQPMRSENRNEGMTRDMRPQAPPAREERSAPRAEPTRQAEPAHEARPAPASKPAPERPSRLERKVEEKNEGPRGSVSYPRPYGTVRAANYTSPAMPSNGYARSTSDYAPRSYNSPTNNMSATHSSSHSYSYSQPTYSQTTRSYSQSARTMSYSQPQRVASYSPQSRSSSYSAPTHSSNYSQSSSHSGGSHSSGGGNRGGSSSSSQQRRM